LGGVYLHTWTGWDPCLTGTRLSPIWKCTTSDDSSIRVSTTPRDFQLRTHGFADLPHVSSDDDQIMSTLSDLQSYQLAIPSPQSRRQRSQMRDRHAGPPDFLLHALEPRLSMLDMR